MIALSPFYQFLPSRSGGNKKGQLQYSKGFLEEVTSRLSPKGWAEVIQKKMGESEEVKAQYWERKQQARNPEERGNQVFVELQGPEMARE